MIAIIPAGGRSARFAGIYKDILPIGDNKFVLSDVCLRARKMGADSLVVISSAEKAGMHERFLRGLDIQAEIVVSSDRGLWEAIRETFRFPRDSLLLLADTLFVPPPTCNYGDLTFGVFSTDEAYRFSVLHSDTIITKSVNLEGTQLAWGCVSWSVKVVEFWNEQEGLKGVYRHYDDAFRDAMQHFQYTTFMIQEYHDIGSWEAYRRYIVGGAQDT